LKRKRPIYEITGVAEAPVLLEDNLPVELAAETCRSGIPRHLHLLEGLQLRFDVRQVFLSGHAVLSQAGQNQL